MIIVLSACLTNYTMVSYNSYDWVLNDFISLSSKHNVLTSFRAIQTQVDSIPSGLLVLFMILLTDSGHRFKISCKYSFNDG